MDLFINFMLSIDTFTHPISFLNFLLKHFVMLTGKNLFEIYEGFSIF